MDNYISSTDRGGQKRARIENPLQVIPVDRRIGEKAVRPTSRSPSPDDSFVTPRQAREPQTPLTLSLPAPASLQTPFDLTPRACEGGMPPLPFGAPMRGFQPFKSMSAPPIPAPVRGFGPPIQAPRTAYPSPASRPMGISHTETISRVFAQAARGQATFVMQQTVTQQSSVTYAQAAQDISALLGKW